MNQESNKHNKNEKKNIKKIFPAVDEWRKANQLYSDSPQDLEKDSLIGLGSLQKEIFISASAVALYGREMTIRLRRPLGYFILYFNPLL